MEMSQYVPALLEKFQAIRLEGQVIGIVRAVFSVIDGDPYTFLHRLDDHSQIAIICWDRLQQNSSL